MARPKTISPTELTRAEMDVMQILWDLHEATVTQIIDLMPTPKPAYNTTSTIVRILVDKKFVGFNPIGKSHKYRPLVSKEAYATKMVGSVLVNFFDNSFTNLISFFSEKEKLSNDEITKIVELLEKKRNEEL